MYILRLKKIQTNGEKLAVLAQMYLGRKMIIALDANFVAENR
jgi:hypothetical protein